MAKFITYKSGEGWVGKGLKIFYMLLSEHRNHGFSQVCAAKSWPFLKSQHIKIIINTQAISDIKISMVIINNERKFEFRQYIHH